MLPNCFSGEWQADEYGDPAFPWAAAQSYHMNPSMFNMYSCPAEGYARGSAQGKALWQDRGGTAYHWAVFVGLQVGCPLWCIRMWITSSFVSGRNISNNPVKGLAELFQLKRLGEHALKTVVGILGHDGIL